MNKKFLSAILFGALAVASTGSFVSCKDYDDDIESLQSQITNLSSVKGDISSVQSALEGKIAAANSAAEAAQKAADAAKAAADAAGSLDAAKAYADAAVAAAKAEMLEQAQKTLDEVVAGAISEDQVKAAIAEALATIETVSPDEVDATVAEAVKAIKNELNIDGKLEAMSKDIAALKTQDEALKAYAKSADVTAEIAAEIKKVEDKIATALNAETIGEAVKAEVANAVKGINASLNTIVPVRLTSLVFAPKTYINGIEAIEFANLKYQGWTTLKQDEPNEVDKAKKPVTYSIANDGATAEYYVSPEDVAKKSIKGLSFLSNVATNTRAAKAAISTDIEKAEIANGKLVLKLKKDDTADWGTPSTSCNSKEEFPIVALKAVLADEVLTAAEKEAKSEVAVFSDWARVVETTSTPIIDNKTVTPHAIKGTAWSYTTSRNNDKVKDHFWNYTTVYPNDTRDGETKDHPNTKDHDKYIAASSKYDNAIDLNTLTQVCTWTEKGGKMELNADPKAASALGLTIEYALVDYWYKNQEDTKDATNQKRFGVIEEGHMLYATSENGLKNNADAVGRTPLVQAVLKDGNKVVDVVYFKVEWKKVETPATYFTGEVAPLGEVPFGCAPVLYSAWIGEEYMNYVYASMNENKGMTRDDFHDAFSTILTKKTPDATKDYNWSAMAGKLANGDAIKGKVVQGDLYLGKVDEAAEKAVALGDMSKYQVVGYVSDLYDAEALTQTHNVEVAVDPSKVNPKAESNFTVDAFFAFKDGSKSYVIVPVTINVKAGAYANKYNYLEPQWEENGGALAVENTAKARPVNPTLFSDEFYGNDAKFQTAPESKPGTNYPVVPAKDVTKGFGTTQLVGNLTYGYMLKKEMPKTISSLVGYTPAGGKQVDAATDIVFDADRLQEVADQTKTKKADWSLSADLKTLYYTAAGKKIAASEIKDNLIYLVDNTDPLDVTKSTGTTGDLKAEPTAPALMLVGNYVPVKVTADNKCKPVDFDKYVVRFIKPLEIGLLSGGIELKDILNDGDAQSVTLSDKYTLQEAFGSRTPIKLFGPEKNQTLIDWYEIKNIEINMDEAIINIDENGKMVTDESKYSKLSEIKNAANKQAYVLKTVKNTETDPKKPAKWVETTKVEEIEGLQFHNNSGQAITKDLIIKLPVGMDTKWQKGLNEKITVTVHPNL